MTPYIITTRDAAEPPNENLAVRAAVKSRRAVATLEEAQVATKAVIDNLPPDHDSQRDWSDHYATAMVDESGGTIGPLPDGTVIEVESATWIDVIDAIPGADWPEIPEHDGDEIAVEILYAYNAQWEKAA